MAKYYPTMSNQLLRKYSGAVKTEYQYEPLADFGQNEKASKKLQGAMVQQKGIRQRYVKSPRTKAIRRATLQAESQGMGGRARSTFVSQNWRQFLK